MVAAMYLCIPTSGTRAARRRIVRNLNDISFLVIVIDFNYVVGSCACNGDLSHHGMHVAQIFLK